MPDREQIRQVLEQARVDDCRTAARLSLDDALALLAELEQADKLAEAAKLVSELDQRERAGDETLDGFEWGRATTALRAALADWSEDADA